ncbi:SET domain-containing protein [Egicoccus sp. AB-alg2]|uniref:SET domain-containing protein n=1 Tax=Egicoccus sp. AB-alg2 TaxID=3242693 RepID=UPI00359E3330
MLDKIAAVVDGIVVMAYRDTPEAQLALLGEERRVAAATGTRLWVALELTEQEPAYVRARSVGEWSTARDITSLRWRCGTIPRPRMPGGPVLYEVRESPVAGRGLFATRRIAADTLLMQAPVLVVPAEQRAALQQTIVDDYVYEWNDDGSAGLVLGVSSMCNHSPDPNAYLWLVPDTESAELWSLRPIAKNEEITVSYRADGGGELWFEVVETD